MKSFLLALALIVLFVEATCGKSQQDLDVMAKDVAKRTGSKRAFGIYGPCMWMVCSKPWRTLKYEQEKSKTVENALKILKQFTKKLSDERQKSRAI